MCCSTGYPLYQSDDGKLLPAPSWQTVVSLIDTNVRTIPEISLKKTHVNFVKRYNRGFCFDDLQKCVAKNFSSSHGIPLCKCLLGKPSLGEDTANTFSHSPIQDSGETTTTRPQSTQQIAQRTPITFTSINSSFSTTHSSTSSPPWWSYFDSAFDSQALHSPERK